MNALFRSQDEVLRSTVPQRSFWHSLPPPCKSLAFQGIPRELTLPRKNLLHARLIPNQVDYAEFCDFVAVPGLVGGTCFTGSLVIRNTLMKSEFIAYNADKWQIQHGR